MTETCRKVPENYLERFNSQMNYYKKQSARCQKEYYWMATAVLILNAAVPVLAVSLETEGPLNYIIASLSALGSIFSGILLLRQSKEKWINYRVTRERLKSEKILYETCSGKYENAGEKTFIVACEEIMQAEHEDWEKLQRDNNKKEE